MTVIKGFLSLKNRVVLKKSIYHYNFGIFKIPKQKIFFIQKMLIKFLKVFILIAKEIVIKTGIYENIALIRSSY